MIMWTLITTTTTVMIIMLLIMQDNVQYTANISFPPVYFAGFIWACPLPRALHNIPWRTGVLDESERNRRRRVGCNSMSSCFRNYKVHAGNYHKIIKNRGLWTVRRVKWNLVSRVLFLPRTRRVLNSYPGLTLSHAGRSGLEIREP